MKETIVRQQLRLSKVDPETVHQTPNEPERSVPSVVDKKPKRLGKKERREREEPELFEREMRQAQERADREANERKRENTKLEAREKTAREARERDNLEAKKAEQEVKEQADREMEEKANREKERVEREKEKLVNCKVHREAKEREEKEKYLAASKISSAWGSTVEKNDEGSRKTPADLSQKGQKNEWASPWDLCSIGRKDESRVPPPIITSSVPSGVFDGAGKFDFFSKEGSPVGSEEEVELRTPLTRKGKNSINTPFGLVKVAARSVVVGVDKLDGFEGPGLGGMSARISISSENERFTDAEEGPPEFSHPALPSEFTPEAFSNSTSKLLTVRCETVPTTPQPWSTPSLTPAQPQVSKPPTAPAKTESDKPLSLWERKKLKTATQPTSTPDLVGDDC